MFSIEAVVEGGCSFKWELRFMRIVEGCSFRQKFTIIRNWDEIVPSCNVALYLSLRYTFNLYASWK